MNDDILNTPIDEYIIEVKELCSGVFWLITESKDLSDWRLLTFEILCDTNGNKLCDPAIPINSKRGSTYNHKKLWESEIKNNSAHKPYNKKSFDYYPRGRVEVSNNRAAIYINPHINNSVIVDELRQKFGLSEHNISEIRIIVDNSAHYQCFIDWGDKRK